MALDKVTTGVIADNAVSTAKVADDAVTGAKIENNPTVAGNLTVAGTSTLTGNTTASGNVTVAGDFVPATPLSNRNMIINGAMQICQRATTTAAAPKGADDNGYYMADRWRLQSGGTTPARYNLIQVNSGLAGLPKAHEVDCTTASASPGADDYIILTQRIEGFNLQQMEFGHSTAKPVTLSFWAKGTAGTYVVELYDSPNNSAACQQFTVTTSWQRFTATFPARTSGTIDNDNTNGMEVNFWLHAGSNFTGGTYAANTWRADTNTNRAVGISNSGAGVAHTTSHYFYFTGVQLELGSNATPFEHRSYGDELRMCQRYYEVGGGSTIWGHPINTDGTGGYRRAPIWFKVTKRASPTCTAIGGSNDGVQGTTVVGTIAMWGSIGNNQHKEITDFTADAEL